MTMTGEHARDGRIRTMAGASTAAIALLIAAPALAQTPPGNSGVTGSSATPVMDTPPNPTDNPQVPPGSGPQAGSDEAIVVTGYRQAVQSAIGTKRDLSVIAETFSAEDIGKLPDVSIAETLGRLPGLAVQRVDGRGQVLSIRGLGPDFSLTLLNGREQVSTSDNRGVEFDQYPAELIAGGTVYKAPYAGLIGQGLAGTVDLQTARPLSYKERVLSLSARGEFNEEGSLNPDQPGTGYRVTGVYIDQFLDNTLGVVLGIAYQSSPQQTKRFNAWGYPTFDCNDARYGIAQAGGGFACRPEYAAANGNRILGGSKPYSTSTTLDRLAVNGTVQWKPTPEFSSTVDGYYSNYRENQSLRGIEFPLWWGGGGETLLPGYTVRDGFITDGTFANVRGVVRNDFNRKATELYAAGWRNVYENEHWKADLDLNFSKADRRQTNAESYSGTGYGVSGPSALFSFAQQPRDAFRYGSNLNYADPGLIQLTDPRGWGGGNDVVQAGFINAPRTQDELYQVRAELARKTPNFGPISAIVIGGNYADRSKKRQIEQNFLALSGPTTSLANGAVRIRPIPSSAFIDGEGGLNWLGVGPQVTYDARRLIADGTYTLVPVALSSFAVPQDWTVSERVATGWVRFDLDRDYGNIKLTGNAGVQFVYTDQSSSGTRVTPGTTGGTAGSTGAVFVPVTDGAKYTYALPSINLNFRLPNGYTFRVAGSRTLARARPDQLNASQAPSINLTQISNTNPSQSGFSASGGNPRLRPYIADGADVSFEKYFGKAGYVQISGFYKSLSSFVNPVDSILTDFSYLAPQVPPGTTVGTFLGVTNGPTNFGDGEIKGIEGTVSLPLDLFAPRLKGFGVQSSASYTQSSVTLGGNPNSPGQTAFRVTVPGLSDWVVNSTIFYERSGFEARVSHRYRSGFLGEVSGISTTRIFQNILGENIFDAQIGYRLQNGSLKGLNLTFQALNLSNQPFTTTNQNKREIITQEFYGRTYLVGAAFKF